MVLILSDYYKHVVFKTPVSLLEEEVLEMKTRKKIINYNTRNSKRASSHDWTKNMMCWETLKIVTARWSLAGLISVNACVIGGKYYCHNVGSK